MEKISRDNFLLVISLVKVNTSLCHVTQGGGGEEEEEMSRNVTQGEKGLKVRKKCHVLFEWSLM